MLKKLNLNSIVWGISISTIFILLIIIIGYSVGSNAKDIWSSALMINAAIATIWLIALFNGYAEFSHSNSKFFGALRNRKNNKLGNYVDDKEKNKPRKTLEEIKENNNNKSKQGPITMYVISFIILLSILWMFV